MSDLQRLTDLAIKFRDDRDWKQFHNPKDMALSLVLEATEFMEHFQWKDSSSAEAHVKKHKQDLADELADVMYWVLLIAHDFQIDLNKAIPSKFERAALKYPIDKAKGNSKKWTEL